MQQDFMSINLRDSAILTGSFVAAALADLSPFNVNPALRNQVMFLLDFTVGSLTSMDIKIQYSFDGSDWYDETFETISGGAAAMSLGLYNFTATGKYTLSIPIKSSYVRILARGNGTATSSLLAIKAIVGTV